MRLPSRVRKRDGREESFELVRLSASMRAAIGYVEGDLELPLRLAEQIEGSVLGDGTIETTDLAATAETMLAESAYPAAAIAYRKYRHQQSQSLQRVRVHTSHGRDDVARPWDRRRLALTLMRDRHLEMALAGQVARRVERRMLGTGSMHFTGRLVSALAENECRSLGLRADSLEAERVGLERRQLSAWLSGDCLPAADGGPALTSPGRDPRALLGGQLLSRYALQDLLSGAQADAILDGRFEIPTLGDWTRPARILLRPVASESEDAFWRRVVDELGRAHEVQIHWPASRSWSGLTKRVPRWVERPDCRLRLFTDDPELAREWVLDGTWVRLNLDGFLHAPASLRSMLAESGRCLLSWNAGHDPLRRARGIETVYGMAVLNMAAPARSAPSTSDFLDRIGESADLACATIKILAERAGGPARVTACLLPAGLSNAIACLLGPGAGEDAATRLLLNIRERLRQAAGRAQLALSHYSPPHPESAGTRLALRDHFVEHGGYAVGWNPADASPIPPDAAFRSVPWLQFSAAAALHDDGLARWSESAVSN